MSNQSKTINIDPNSLKITEGGSSKQKRKKTHSPSNIRDRTSEKNTSSAKKRFLRYIHEKRKQEYEKTMNNCDNSFANNQMKETNGMKEMKGMKETKENCLEQPSTIVITDMIPSKSSTSFDESVSFLKTMQNKNNGDVGIMNFETVSNTNIPISTTSSNVTWNPNSQSFESNYLASSSIGIASNKNISITESLADGMSSDSVGILQSPFINKNTSTVYSPPRYGCLKGGSLPTYRTYKNRTSYLNGGVLNEHPNQSIHTSHLNDGVLNEHPNIHLSDRDKQSIEKEKIEEQYKNSIQGGIGDDSGKKRRKTLKRTFLIGKSKIYKNVGVLIKNKQLRNSITTTAQLMKQTPIDDIRHYLIKNGFIKIGSPAPHDVLRQMYESALLIGGEVRNYNPENLLFNYLNANDKM